MVTAIIPAAGAGRRFGGPKQFLSLAGRPILAHTLDAFETCDRVDAVIVVAPPEDLDRCSRDIVQGYGFGKVTSIVPGGPDRRDSVRNGLYAANPSTDVVVIHDAVRPFVSPALITSSIERCRETGAVVVAVPVKETVKVCRDGRVLETPLRETLWSVQTPQTFRYGLILEAHKRALTEGWSVTDDAMLVERIGQEVVVVEGSYDNIKITTPEDLSIAEALWMKRHGTPVIRVGIGYDIHRLVEGRPLILGGVEVPFNQGLLGHSDADVLSHAVADALLGAVGAGDIGHHFPDTDPAFRGISSLLLLQRVADILQDVHTEVVNVDATIIAERPKLAPFFGEMGERIATSLSIPRASLSLKATTAEGLGEVGRGEAIAAHAVALVRCWKAG
jgi:2-C-methyl-D-erythritol 4-phosphate cytidylyltransferase/2-C-methyl-D-erythritol 2,4-cyclodiphosphate synthase